MTTDKNAAQCAPQPSGEKIAPALWDGGWDYDMTRMPNGPHEVAFNPGFGINVVICWRIIHGPSLTPEGYPIPASSRRHEYRVEGEQKHWLQSPYAWRRIAIPPVPGHSPRHESDEDAERWVMNCTPDFVREYIARRVSAPPAVSCAAREALAPDILDWANRDLEGYMAHANAMLDKAGVPARLRRIDKTEMALATAARMALPAAGGEASKREADLREALTKAQEKLRLYRAEHCGIYIGGVEFNALMKMIDAALSRKDG